MAAPKAAALASTSASAGLSSTGSSGMRLEMGSGTASATITGAGGITARVAMEKAQTAAATKRPTKFWEDRIKERPAFVTFPGSAMIQGGLPLIHQGDCVGAIGVSGVQSHEDEQVAQAGVTALG